MVIQVTSLLDESSNLAAQMMPGVQNFGAAQPADVAKPKPFKPASPDPTSAAACADFPPVDLDSSSDSSNQTDDQKAKENIVRFVSQLVERAFMGAGSGQEDESLAEPEPLHQQQAWSGSESSGSPRFSQFPDGSPRLSTPYDGRRRLSHPLDGSPRFSHSYDSSPRLSNTSDGSPRMSHPFEGSPRFSHAVEGSPRFSMLGESSPRQLFADGSPRTGAHPTDGSPLLSNLDGSPRTEASAWWRHQELLLLSEAARLRGRRRSSTDFTGCTTPSDTVWPSGSSTGSFMDFASHGSRGMMHSTLTDTNSGRRGSWGGQQHGESLTDDFKEAVACSTSAFHTVQVSNVHTQVYFSRRLTL